MKTLICNHCKRFWIFPKNTCDYCGSSTLTETHPLNALFAENFMNVKLYINTNKTTFTQSDLLNILEKYKKDFAYTVLDKFNIEEKKK